MNIKGWKVFYSLFGALPSYSRTKSKISSDPELAKQMVAGIDPDSLLEEEGKSKEPEISLEGYDPYLAKMDQAIEEVRMLSLTVKSIVSDKKSKIKFNPQPRPKTAVEKELERLKNKAGENEAKSLMSSAGF